MEFTPDDQNKEFQEALNLIKYTRQSVFLTGKAGTGKSTFLRYVCSHTKKRHVVLAPTGIAAINAGGSTLHSFFKLPFHPLLPDDPNLSLQRGRIHDFFKYSKEQRKLLERLELVVIDEISMVRADIIDTVDRILRVYGHNLREPFGGKQLLLVGDVFQLEPVVKREFSKRTGLKVRAKRALLQSEGYMVVTGAEKTSLAALVGGNRFYWKVVCRDEQKIVEIIALEKASWEENVLAGREPVPDGSGATTDFLNEKYASSNGNTILLPEEALDLCRRYEELSGQLNELQDKKDAVSNQLKNFLKNNESGVIGEYRVTWKQVTSTAFDKKRLERENHVLYEEYLTKKQYRRLVVA